MAELVEDDHGAVPGGFEVLLGDVDGVAGARDGVEADAEERELEDGRDEGPQQRQVAAGPLRVVQELCAAGQRVDLDETQRDLLEVALELVLELRDLVADEQGLRRVLERSLRLADLLRRDVAQRLVLDDGLVHEEAEVLARDANDEAFDLAVEVFDVLEEVAAG